MCRDSFAMNLYDAGVPSVTTTLTPPPNHFPNGRAGSGRRAGLPPRPPHSSLSRPMARPSPVLTFGAMPPPSSPVAIHNVASSALPPRSPHSSLSRPRAQPSPVFTFPPPSAPVAIHSVAQSALPPRSPHSSHSRPMAQPSSVFTFGAMPPPSAPVAIHSVAPSASPAIPFTRPNSARGSGATVSGSNSVMAQSSPGSVFPDPMEMSVGVESEKEVHGGTMSSHGEDMLDEFILTFDDDLAEFFNDVSDSSHSGGGKKTTSGVKRRADTEIARDGDETNAVGLGFDASLFTKPEVKQILASADLKNIAASSPRRCKKILANRKSAARSKELKAKYVSHLEDKILTLEMESSTLSARCKYAERVKKEQEDKNKQLRILVDGMEQQARLRDSLAEQLNGEIHRLKLATGEVRQYGMSNNMQPMDANMFQPMDANRFQPMDANMFQPMDGNMFQPFNVGQFPQPQANPNFE